MAKLELQAVSKQFKTGKVLDRISLAAEDGEIVAVFGPSGSGKTLLLRIVAGVEQPDEGRILLARPRRHRRCAGSARRGNGVPELRALSAHVGVRQCRERADRAQCAPRRSFAPRSRRSPRFSRSSMFSGTRRANCPTARSSARRWPGRWWPNRKSCCSTIPLRNVDAKLRYEMRLELPSLLKLYGSTVLYVTQDYKEAMALGDRIAVLSDREFAQVARPAEIYRKPATMSVARLFGDPTINLIPVAPLASPAGMKIGVSAAPRCRCRPGLAIWRGSRACSACGRKRLRSRTAPRRTAFPVEVVAVTPLNEKNPSSSAHQRWPRSPRLRSRDRRGAAPAWARLRPL